MFRFSVVSILNALGFLLVWVGMVILIAKCTFPLYEDMDVLLAWWRYPGWGILLILTVLAYKRWKVSPSMGFPLTWKKVLTVVGLSLAYWVVSFVISRWSLLQTGTLYFAVGITDKNILFVIEALVLAPFIEEFAFLGGMLEYLSRTNGAVISVLWSSALFSLYHMTLSQFLPTFFCGILLGFIYLRMKSVWYAVVAHFVYNLTCFFIWVK